MTMDLKVELTALAADLAVMSGRVTDFVAAMPEPGKPKAREPGWYWVDDGQGWEIWHFLGYGMSPRWSVPKVAHTLTRDPMQEIGPRLEPPA